MSIIHLPGEQFPQVLDASTRSVFATCPQKYYREVICGLQPKDGTSVHLQAGAAYADALEAYRREFYTTGDYEKAVADGFLALVKGYGPNDFEGEKKTIERMIAAYIEYLYKYPPGTEHAKPSMGPSGPRVEFSFTIEIPGVTHPITGDPLLYAGTFDQLADYTGGLFIFDDKTTSRMGALWKHQWTLRSQFTGYVAGARESNIAVLGAIVRGMCILVNEIKTEEVITYRPEWLIQRWRERLTYDARRIIQCWETGYWPNQGEESGACVSWGVCPFHTLCTAQFPEPYVPVYYEEARWDPLLRERIYAAKE